MGRKRMEQSSSSLISLYLSWPQSMMEAYLHGVTLIESKYANYTPPIISNPRLLLGCGMGGSGYSISTAFSLLDDEYPKLAYHVNRLPSPPRYISDKDFLISVSYSGETMETIECTRRSLPIVGQVAAVARANSSLYNLVRESGGTALGRPGGGLPRASLGELVGSTLALLGGSRLEDIVKDIMEELNVDRAMRVAQVLYREIAYSGEPSVPLFVSCGPGELIVSRWVDELAENAKLPSLHEVYPDAGHNKVMRWANGKMIPGLKVFYVSIAVDGICGRVRHFVESVYGKIGDLVVIDDWEDSQSRLITVLLEAAIAGGLASLYIADRLGVDAIKTVYIELYKSVLRGNQ